MQDKMNKFSLALGLFDYINPIFYTITTITILRNLYGVMNKSLFIVYVIGAIISIIFGLSIPTLKSIVGLGIVEFKMPVNLVFYVNSGIFISGMMLLIYSFKLNIVTSLFLLLLFIGILVLIYLKTKKFNSVAVLTGGIGYLMIYISLILLAISKSYILSIVLYSIAIVLFIYLILVGTKSNLKIAKVHWAIEISNVICQGLVAISTVLLFL